MLTSPGGPLEAPSLTNAVDDETLGMPVDCKGRVAVSVEVIGAGTTSSGVITIETAGTQTFADTWSSIATVNASDVNGGETKFIYLPLGSFAWVRTRVSTVIGGGGSVSTVIRGV